MTIVNEINAVTKPHYNCTVYDLYRGEHTDRGEHTHRGEHIAGFVLYTLGLCMLLHWNTVYKRNNNMNNNNDDNNTSSNSFLISTLRLALLH